MSLNQELWESGSRVLPFFRAVHPDGPNVLFNFQLCPPIGKAFLLETSRLANFEAPQKCSIGNTSTTGSWRVWRGGAGVFLYFFRERLLDLFRQSFCPISA